MSKHEVLIGEKIKSQLDANARVMHAFPWETGKYYAEWLAQTHFYVNYSTRLLAASASRFLLSQNKLHLRFATHMGEERSHELLCIRDLQHLGKNIANFEELPSTLALYSSQFYLIEHHDPSALLGYILFLEAMASTTGKRVFERVLKAYGTESCRFWKVHAEEDVDHVADAVKQLGQLSEVQQALVCRNVSISGYLYNSMINQIVAVHEKADANIAALSSVDWGGSPRLVPATANPDEADLRQVI